ncbi:MAG: GNAT family N-acetyltransferase [Solirubrobacterales bacterium]|nr:GNAT family N-acetyltransferase [Solirubrobacterales bacterium]
MSLRAELIEDGGLAASSPEFFRSPGFLAAESATHSVRIEGGPEPVTLPVLVRAIRGGEQFDAISPYGYPGASPALAAPPDPAEVDWSATGLVSLFVRDRVGAPSLAGGTTRSELQIADPSLEPKIRKRLAEQIAQNARRGWVTAVRAGRAIEEEHVQAFERVYGETMERVGAAARYRFSREYLAAALAAERAFLVTATHTSPPSPGDEVGAAAIMARSDGYLHYFLGGIADFALEDSPMKNVFAAMISHAGELELPLSLGGGVEPGDSLERFKRGFANRTEPFRTHEIVCGPDAYADLSRGVEAPRGFFPAYRAG